MSTSVRTSCRRIWSREHSFPGANLYLALKAPQFLAVAFFLGNVITGQIWKAHGDRTADPRMISPRWR